MSIESLVQPTFLLTEIELNRSVIRVSIHFNTQPLQELKHCHLINLSIPIYFNSKEDKRIMMFPLGL